MPAVSKAQFRFFKHLESSPADAKKHGMTAKQAAEFTEGQKPGKLPEKSSAEKRYGTKS